MQGTIAVLMALSGLGCHHKSCNDCYVAPACYSAPYLTGCYSACYDVGYVAYSPGCYATACYGGWDACYGAACYGAACYGSACYGGCYGGGHRHGGLFGCFKRKHCGVCNPPVAYGCYGGCYGGWDACYSTPVFGSYGPVYAMGPVVSSQMVSPQYPAAQGVPMTPSKQGWAAPQGQYPGGTGAATTGAGAATEPSMTTNPAAGDRPVTRPNTPPDVDTSIPPAEATAPDDFDTTPNAPAPEAGTPRGGPGR